ncbi:nuclear transport factor 2 family protein [Neolewinella aurantiaca]|uniref:Nuclear transport factor 2 family protein n=1 Tax=Neolewinella aurantiaca TaxID=2602767 RepID=A0A5C7FKV7_9BACT|nr:nuclear transport factor 2 family protein [Neolewinella aurantiaca]TXF91367.1 nuclear transport factor 2 family protein [Neolewinella aurantiaca]
MTNSELISTFYEAFSNQDAEAMVACYSPDVVFEDPAFGRLEGKDAHDMWRMLMSRGGAATEVSYGNVQSKGQQASADWWARYNYGPKGRAVINEIHAEFIIEDGKIVKHTDSFNLWRWARQALGLNGMLLGWSAFFKARMQETTRGMLTDFQAKQ